VTFSGTAGFGEPSPTVTVWGSHFGFPPPGTSNNTTSCGTYTANGDVYGTRFYFRDRGNFQAGYSGPKGTNCVGLIIQSWSQRKIVFSFGNAYGTFPGWYLSNGDQYAISIKHTVARGTVHGLS
jgi:hypothetical protein